MNKKGPRIVAANVHDDDDEDDEGDIDGGYK